MPWTWRARAIGSAGHTVASEECPFSAVYLVFISRQCTNGVRKEREEERRSVQPQGKRERGAKNDWHAAVRARQAGKERDSSQLKRQTDKLGSLRQVSDRATRHVSLKAVAVL